MILLWCLWMERKEKVFNGKFTPNVVLMAHVHRLVLEHNTYMKQVHRISVPRRAPRAHQWRAPPPGVIKLNSDAALDVEG